MPYLTPKARAGNNWLPSQVQYGMDCSATDPAEWKPFGAEVERLAAAAKLESLKPAAKPGQPQQ